MTVFNVGGWAVDSVEGPKFTALATATAVPSTAVFRGGAAFTHSGRRYCEIISGAVPATAVKLGGVAHRQDGAVYVTNTLPSAIYYRGPRKLPCNAEGAIYVNPNAAISQRRAGFPFASDGGLVSRTGDIGLIWEMDADEAESLADCCTVAPTITRATTKLRTNSSGYWESVAVDTILREYDAVTAAVRGFWMEETRTNLMLHSTDFSNAVWSKTDTTVTADSIIGPDGTRSGDLFTAGSSANARVLQDYTAALADAPQAASFFFKKGNNDWIMLRVCEAANNTNAVRAWFNLNTGAVGTVSNGGTGSGATASISNCGNGWYRCTIVGSVNNGATALRVDFLAPDADNSLTRVSGATYYGWHGQLESSALSATSPIVTGAASATRNLDAASVLLSAIAGFNAASVSLFVEAYQSPNGNRTVFTVGDGTTSERHSIVANNATVPSAARLFMVDGGATQADIISALGSWPAGSVGKCAYAAEANNVNFTVNGTSGSTDTSATMPTVTDLRIGVRADGVVSTIWNSPIRKLRLYNRRLAAAEREAMTA